MKWAKQFYETHKKNIVQAFRYLVTGGASFVSDYLVFLLLSSMMHYQIATYAGLLVGLVVNYLLSKIWVFENKSAVDAKEVTLFAAVTAIGFALTGLGMYIGVSLLAFDKRIVKLVVAVIVFVLNFLARKFIIWRER